MMLNFLLTICFYFSIAVVSLWAQPGLVSADIRAKDITPNGFTLQFETDVPCAYIVTFFPVLHQGDTLIYADTNKLAAHEIIFAEAAPSQFFRADFQIYDVYNDTLYYSKYYASASLSSGDIKTYFNHAVDQGFSQANDAINVGAAMQDTLIAYINRVEETLDIAIYNSYSANATTGIAGAINNAHNRGVQVRVIHQGGTSSLMIPNLNSTIPVLARPSGDFAGLMHHKFIVADAKHQDANKSWVWTGATNWTTGQINGPDRNNVIIVYDKTLALNYLIEFEEMWGSKDLLPNITLSLFGADKRDNTPKEFKIGGRDVYCYFSPSDNTEQQIIHLINEAQHNIAVITMLITRYGIANALVNKFNSGVRNFAILLDSQNPLGSQKPYLMDNLPPGRVLNFTASGIMHHKYMVVDNGYPTAAVLTGSHNWSASANQRNDENTLIIFDEDIANQYFQAAAYLYTEVGGTLNTENLKNNHGFSIFPNPASDKLFVCLENKTKLSLHFYDLNGRRVMKKHLVPENQGCPIELCIKNLKDGFYLVKIIDETTVSAIKLVVTR